MIYDCSVDYLTLVIRAPGEKRAKEIAVEKAKDYGINDAADRIEPSLLFDLGPEAVLVEDCS